MPERIKKFPLNSKGYPVFYPVKIDLDGVPLLAEVDPDKREDCIVNSKCGVCGEPLGNDIVCIGDPTDEKLLRKLTFKEAAMHMECAEYASKVCPYLSTPGYKMSHKRKAADEKQLESLPLDMCFKSLVLPAFQWASFA
jgi:hypothetical protein